MVPTATCPATRDSASATAARSSDPHTVTSRPTIPNGCPIRTSHPAALGRESRVVPKHTSRVRKTQLAVSDGSGHSASVHHDAVIATIAPNAAMAAHARADEIIRPSK